MNPVTTHPKELTREAVEKWLEGFKKKLNRTTSRNDLDRLILSVERQQFEGIDNGDWEEVVFENGEGKVFGDGEEREKWAITALQKTILEKNPTFKSRKIARSEFKEETGKWILHRSFKSISEGGEAIVLEEKFGELEVAVRVQAFDSALFVGKEELKFEIHLSKNYATAENDDEDDVNVIPLHSNIIKNYCNIEVFLSKDEKNEDCLGWITIMEKCDCDLRSRLKNEDLDLEERKKIAIGVKDGLDYLKSVGIEHKDKKPENVLLKNGEARWIDYGTLQETTGRGSYREMGYARRGSKYRYSSNLFSGSAAFSGTIELCNEGQEEGSPPHILILCDWKSAWSLLYNPLEEDGREMIKNELKKFNAAWLSRETPTNDEIESLSKIISLKNAPSHFCLDDPNLTKSCAMANLKQKMTKQINFDFKNVTKNVLNQKETNLCVPISVTTLLRWAIKNDLRVEDRKMKLYFSFETIFTILTMVVYPRSLAGLNLNPKFEEQKFQTNEIELLLKRLKFETYLYQSGWAIIQELNLLLEKRGDFDFELVLLHDTFSSNRPLTVTGAYLNPDGSKIFHQMVLDRVENSEFILQNTLIDHSGARIRIPISREFYASQEMMEDCFNYYNNYVFYGPNKEFIPLTNENFQMDTEKWYLLPQAYSITLTPW